MNRFLLPSLAIASLAAGCAAPVQDDNAPQQDDEIQFSQLELTVQECATQRDTCFRKNPLFGLFTCPAQYTQCVATAENGLPAEVTAAVADAASCTRDAVACVADATTPVELAKCADDEAQCVADIVGIELPDVVEGTAQCVDSTVSCINEARSVSTLTACGESLAVCAVEQVASVVPEEVGEVIAGANDCRLELDSCIADADSASGLTSCSQDGAGCLAGTLGVELPDVPLDNAVECAENAADCALHVRSISDIAECAEELRTCAIDVVGEVPVPEELTCDQKFTTCVAKNPFNFFGCAAEASKCRD